MRTMLWWSFPLFCLACASTPGGDRTADDVGRRSRPSSAPNSAERRGEAVPIDDDTTMTTASGASFEVFKGWLHTEGERFELLQDPEGELTLTLVEVEGESGAEAIAAAWERFRPGFDRPVAQTQPAVARAPWDEQLQLIYEVPTAEGRMVLAVASRSEETWYVVLIDGTKESLGRRGAQLNTTVHSYRPAGARVESLAGREPHLLDEGRGQELAGFVERWREEAKVPGVAIALVQDGEIVFEQGFGERQRGKGDPVTVESPFLIGSATKSLTSLMMARLIDEERFAWDTNVQALMPSFALGDEQTTRKLQMRHTVCACTGLPRQDLEFIFQFAGVTPEERLDELRKMKPTTGFGETFQYSNALVAAGGYVAARTLEPDGELDAAYVRAMRSRVFEPAGMHATTFDFAAVAKRPHAMPHAASLGGEPLPIPLEYELAVRSVAPAGGAWSTARDMGRYVVVELSKGETAQGRRLVSERSLVSRWEPQTRVSDKTNYGLGLFLAEDKGLRVISHGGNTLGFTADVFFLPEAGVGGVILTNAQGANAFTGAVRAKLMELWFDATPRSDKLMEAALSQRAQRSAKLLERVAQRPDPKWSERLVGTWRNASLGDLTVRARDGALVVDAGEWESAAAQHRDTDGSFSLLLTGAPLAGLELLPRGEGKETTLLLETAQQKYRFEQVGGP